ncbi:MAG: hydantoinase/oxoprolinase family protein, partial [Halobacteria archaeon]|nr:hydantoinase/oxoprolinase family protein [Halobacteria archaeon]
MTDDTRIGVDVGGTFTDVVTVHEGRVNVTKTPSTPDSPERGVVNGLRKARSGFDFSDISFLSHGTTVATNAALEGEWADTALVTTQGFRDALEIGRQARPDIYDFQVEKAPPIVERDKRFEVEERLDEKGNVVMPLDEGSIRSVAEKIKEKDVESVAVCLLFSFENEDHERRVKDILEEELDTSFSISTEALPEIREYERTLTTCLNAGLKPVIDDYLGELESEKNDLGIPSSLKIMQSNGGIITSEAARQRPVNTLLSGPAAGVQGATYIASLCGIDDIITMDMGGTSCDVSLVQDRDPIISTEVEVGDYPVGVPMIDIHTIGSGGGSIAWIDKGDALRVGPRSAGADPGPICYDRGGDKPTITDAHVLLGRLDPEGFAPGSSYASRETIRGVLEDEIAHPLGMDATEAAQGIIDIANANMERA